MFIEIAHAAWANAGIFGNQMSFWDFVLLGISLFVIFSGVFSIVFILWWGLLLILSGGKDDKIKPAINTIRYAVIGIVVTILTIFLFPILGKLLGLDVEKYAEPKRIFAKIEELGTYIFGNTNSTISIEDIDSVDNTTLDSDFSDL